ncbi:MAG TPA: cytochrome P450 [Thermoleophilaceae bacterium]|nr:cytochrome P450 [Thermoleophilaceae bacterium]
MATATADAPAGTRRARGKRVLGDLDGLRNDPLGLFSRAAATGEEVVRFRAAHRSVFLLAGPRAIAHVGIHNRENYVKGVSYDALRVPLPNALLTIDGEGARERRRLLMPLFARRTVIDQVPTIVSAVESLCERWDGFADSGEEFDAASEMNRLTFDVVGRILVGTELGPDMDHLEARLADASAWVARRTRALVPLPPSLPTPGNVAYRRAYRDLARWADGLIETRRDPEKTGAVARLIAAGRDRPLTTRQLRDEIAAFLMAGYQTTASALSWAWYLLARHPDEQDRLGEAARIALDREPPDAERLDVAPYIGQVLDETMRLYPPGWAFTRTPLADDEVAGHPIPAGSIVIVSSYANHRSPRLWDQPERFDPERFARGRRNTIPAYAYFPFGVGPHACIGKHMAEIEARLALAMLARRYRIEALERDEVPPTPAITLTPGRPIRVRAVRR